MPRKQGSSNNSNFHYKVIQYEDNNKENIVEEKYFKTQKDITEKYGINRSSIYFVVNPDEKRLSKKWKNFHIEKLQPPIPIYTRTPTFEAALVA